LKKIMSLCAALLFVLVTSTHAQTAEQPAAAPGVSESSTQIAYTCEPVSSEPTRKICTDTSAIVYLKENFKIKVDPDAPAFAGVTCDWGKSTDPGIFNGKWGKPCESKGTGERTIVGWADKSINNGDLLTQLGNYQLSLINIPHGKLFCFIKDSLKNFNFNFDVRLGAECKMVLDSGRELFMTFAALVPTGSVAKRIFVVVMNGQTSTSMQDTGAKIEKLLTVENKG
jgi:hypothetical protein